MRALAKRGLSLVFTVWTASALAVLSEDDALRIGRDANVEGLRALVAQRNPVLIYRATSAWNFAGARELSEPLEALLAEHYGDREIQRPLVSLLARSIDQHERYPKYRT